MPWQLSRGYMPQAKVARPDWLDSSPSGCLANDANPDVQPQAAASGWFGPDVWQPAAELWEPAPRKGRDQVRPRA